MIPTKPSATGAGVYMHARVHAHIPQPFSDAAVAAIVKYEPVAYERAHVITQANWRLRWKRMVLLRVGGREEDVDQCLKQHYRSRFECWHLAAQCMRGRGAPHVPVALFSKNGQCDRVYCIYGNYLLLFGSRGPCHVSGAGCAT